MSQFITKKQLPEIVPFSHTHVLRLENERKVSRRIKPYGGRNGKTFWVLEEIEDWIQSQITLRDNSTNTSSFDSLRPEMSYTYVYTLCMYSQNFNDYV